MKAVRATGLLTHCSIQTPEAANIAGYKPMIRSDRLKPESINEPNAIANARKRGCRTSHKVATNVAAMPTTPWISSCPTSTPSGDVGTFLIRVACR